MDTMYGTNQMSEQLVGAARPCALAGTAAAAGWLDFGKSTIAMPSDVPTTHRHRWPRGSQ